MSFGIDFCSRGLAVSWHMTIAGVGDNFCARNRCLSNLRNPFFLTSLALDAEDVDKLKAYPDSSTGWPPACRAATARYGLTVKGADEAVVIFFFVPCA